MRALWSDRQICSHNVFQKNKRIRCFSGENPSYPKHLLRQKIVNNLARLVFTLRNKNSLARLFSKVIF